MKTPTQVRDEVLDRYKIIGVSYEMMVRAGMVAFGQWVLSMEESPETDESDVMSDVKKILKELEYK